MEQLLDLEAVAAEPQLGSPQALACTSSAIVRAICAVALVALSRPSCASWSRRSSAHAPAKVQHEIIDHPSTSMACIVTCSLHSTRRVLPSKAYCMPASRHCRLAGY